MKSLEKKIEEATPIIGAISNIFRRASISSAKSKIKKLSEYRDEIRKKHSEIIADARKKLGRTTAKAGEMNLEIINEFTDLFNGVSLNISEEEAEELKKLDGVKEIYPDYKARAMIIDSVPLIGADRVWQLDKDGNNCILSGKECLTGKGIIISVIDTGVDYTHQDLGGCLGENCKVVGGYDFINNDNNPMDDEGHGTHVAATAAGNGILKAMM